MADLMNRYCVVHRQGFVPILVEDAFDAVMLVEASVAAGAKAVEITCRRRNVREEVRRIRRQFPDVLLLVGSVVDDGNLLRFLKRRRPDMPSMDELADLDVHGFVSFMPMSARTLSRFSATHLLMPGIETVPEAVSAVEAGAHFAKLYNTAVLGGPQRVSMMSGPASHGLLPLFVTGGVSSDRIDAFVRAGAALLGAGWGVILGNQYQALQKQTNPDILAAALRRSLESVVESRGKMSDSLNHELDDAAYLRSLPHYHPFMDDLVSTTSV